ncbi:AbrB/MazE/SpoVT family DNA-binding domain-containing protein [Tepidicaulis sp. LMO-SS28]|uniref:AbrB/MazE/SpoVT family DNA-binding domain-containing protein n=1 Tax=Tepidicaulis sp. LMO-SS28 TaxID=3447455 RepID=UPI003EE122A0
MTKQTITAKGQVTLRKHLLKHLGVGPGEKIEMIELPDGRIEVRAARPAGSIDGFLGSLKGRSRKAATLEEIKEAAASGWAGRR